MPPMQPFDDSMPRRIFRVGGVTVDELRSELRVDGKLRPIERRARALFLALLSRPREVVSKAELVVAGWGNADAARDGSLNTAIFSLRGALGPSGHEIVKSVRDVGYTIGLPVETWTAVEMPRLALGLQVGDTVPSRPQWRLERSLSPSARVWCAVQDGIKESWVFSFADTVERSVMLRREATASEDLHGRLGDGRDRAKIVDCDFDRIPHFIARPFVGTSLDAFAASGELQKLGLEALVDLAKQITRTMARAHGVGILHGAIRPSAILLIEAKEELLACVVGFLGRDVEEASPEASASDLPALGADSHAQLYLAPEVKAGGPLTAASDLYALGILLLGLVTRSLNTPLTPASIADIDDPLLQSDIATAMARSQDRRWESVAVLAHQLEALPARRAAAREQAALELQVERYRRIGFALRVLLVATGVFAVLAATAWHERTVARAQRDRGRQITAVTEEAVSGLVDDIAHGFGTRSGVRLDVLQILLGRAEATLDRMIRLTPGEPNLRGLQARGLTDFARVLWEQDDLPRALALGIRAADIQRGLLNQSAGNMELWTDLSESQRLIGDVRMRQRDQTGALAAYREVVEIDRRVEAAKPGDEANQRRVAQAEGLLGDVQMAQGHDQEALTTYRTAGNMISKHIAAHADDSLWLADLAASQQKVGDALDALHDWHGALDVYQQEVAIRHRLLDHTPGNNGWRHDLSKVQSDIGDEQYDLKDFKAARTSYQDALLTDQELARADPTNETWQRNVAVVYADIGDADDALGDRVGSVAAQEAANVTLNAVAGRSPEDADLQRDLSGTEMNLADGLIKNGDLVGARPHAARALQIATRLAKAHPADPDLANALQLAAGVAKHAGLRP